VIARIGDESLLYRWKLSGDAYTVVVWRFRSVFAVIGGEDLGTQRMLTLARVQQRRIAAALR
jgi:hypothetical protein